MSRGEIVEIGDSFRISEIIEHSGCSIKEVGTTNITRLSDYSRAVTDNTAAFLKVHSSNFKLTGFTQSVSGTELKPLAAESGVMLIEDMGSGVLCDVSRYGMPYERQIRDAIKEGIELITISGDKLLGGPQAGIILGKREYIEKIRRNQLTRCMRIDKLCLIALEATLLEYMSDERRANLPVYRMAALSTDELSARAGTLLGLLKDADNGLRFAEAAHESMFGGGTTPGEGMPSVCIKITSKSGINNLESYLRACDTPIIGLIKDNSLLLDLRTIEIRDYQYIADMLKSYRA